MFKRWNQYFDITPQYRRCEERCLRRSNPLLFAMKLYVTQLLHTAYLWIASSQKTLLATTSYRAPHRWKLLFGSLILISISLLNGCSTTTVHHAKDGPPPFDVDVSRIPDAVPRCEPCSRIGNKPSYCVQGQRYAVMRSSKNYKERGIASWYGTLFHAKRTSNGDRYNMLAMTAAHKSLPLPTYVEVTNLSNHRKVIVKVNDRGPFEANRLIDLSYVAAKKLGMLARGTAYVEIRAIDPVQWAQRKRNTLHPIAVANGRDTSVMDQEPSLRAHAFRGRGNPDIRSGSPRLSASQPRDDDTSKRSHALYLQVGIFQNKSNALRLQTQLTKLLHSSVTIADTSVHTKTMYRVQVGPIQNMTTANTISNRLKSMGFNSKEIR